MATLSSSWLPHKYHLFREAAGQSYLNCTIHFYPVCAAWFFFLELDTSKHTYFLTCVFIAWKLPEDGHCQHLQHREQGLGHCRCSEVLVK